MRITFSPPDISEEDIEAVAETMRSGWITTGPKTKEFEKEIAKKSVLICAFALTRKLPVPNWCFVCSA